MCVCDIGLYCAELLLLSPVMKIRSAWMKCAQNQSARGRSKIVQEPMESWTRIWTLQPKEEPFFKWTAELLFFPPN